MGFSVWNLLIILVIVLLLFGAKRLRNIGSDLGAAVKGFKNSVSDEAKVEEQKPEGKVIEGEAVKDKHETK